MIVNWNGQIIPSDAPIFSVQNRAFRFGDGLFESMLRIEHQIPLWSLHIDRLIKSAETLGFSLTDLDPKKLAAELEKTCQTLPNARIRLTVYRNDGGLYSPTDDGTSFLIQASPNGEAGFASRSFSEGWMQEAGLRVGIFDQFHLPVNELSGLKTCNSLPYVLMARDAKQRNLDDVLICNAKGNVVESSNANLFCWKENTLISPPNSEGAVQGVFRRFLLELASDLPCSIKVQPIPLDELMGFDSIWLTNAVRGIRWVHHINQHTFSPGPLTTVHQALEKRIWSL